MRKRKSTLILSLLGWGVEQALHGLPQSITSEKQKLEEKPNFALSNINNIYTLQKKSNIGFLQDLGGGKVQIKENVGQNVKVKEFLVFPGIFLMKRRVIWVKNV